MEQPAVGEAPLAPLMGLVERLRAEVTELQGRWEALGEELEAKRRKFRLAEATVELLQRQQEAAKEEKETGPEEGGAMIEGESVPQAAQASPFCSPSEVVLIATGYHVLSSSSSRLLYEPLTSQL
jgi:hypothetical protein